MYVWLFASCPVLIASEWMQYNAYAQTSSTPGLAVIPTGLFMAHSLVLTIEVLAVLPICLYQNYHLHSTKVSIVFNQTLRHEFSIHCYKQCPSVPSELRSSWPIKFIFILGKNPCVTVKKLMVRTHFSRLTIPF